MAEKDDGGPAVGGHRRPRLTGAFGSLRNLLLPGSAADLRSQVVSQGAGTTLLNLGSVALGFLTTLVLTRLLGARGYGTYVYALAWPTVLAVGAQGGYTLLLVRNIAAYSALEQWGLVRGIIQRSQRVVLSLSAALALAAGIVGWAFVGHRQPLVRQSFFIGLLLVPCLALMMQREAVMRGYRRVALGRLPETVIHPLVLLVLIGAGYVLGQRASPPQTMVATVAATIVAVTAGTIFVSRATPVEVRTAIVASDRAVWARSARSLLAVNGIQLVSLHMSVLLLGAIKSVDETAVLSVVLRWSGMVSFVQTAAAVALAPNLARLHVTSSHARIQRVVSKASLGLLILATPVALGLLVFGEQALALFGDEFRSGGPALRILVFGEVVNVACGLVGVLLIISGQERVLFTAAAWLTGGSLGLSVLLISAFGLEGAAVGQATALAAQNIILAIIVWYRLGIYAPAIGRRLLLPRSQTKPTDG